MRLRPDHLRTAHATPTCGDGERHPCGSNLGWCFLTAPPVALGSAILGVALVTLVVVIGKGGLRFGALAAAGVLVVATMGAALGCAGWAILLDQGSQHAGVVFLGVTATSVVLYAMGCVVALVRKRRTRPAGEVG